MAAKTWTGAGGDNNWSSGGNWNGSTVPATTDPITFDSTSVKNCTIDNLGTWSGGTFTIASTYSGTITKNVAMTTGNFSIAGGSFVDNNATAWTSTATGTFTQTNGTFQTGVTMSVGGNFTISGGVFTQFAQGLIIFTVGTTQTVDTSTYTFVACRITGTAGNITIAAGSTIPLENSATSSLSGTHTITVNGTLVIGTGTWTVQSTNNKASLNVTSTGTISGITDLNITGDLTIDPAATFPSGVTVTFRPSPSLQTVTATATTFGTCVISAQNSGSSFTIAANTTIPLGASPISTLIGSATITVNGTVSITSGVWTITTSTGNPASLVVGATGTVSGGTGISVLSGSVTIDAAATIPSNWNVTLDKRSASAFTFDGGGHTFGNFTITRTSAGTATLTIAGSNTFNDFKSNGGVVANTITFTAGTTQTVSTFTVSGVSGKLVTLNSSVAGSKWFVTSSSGTLNCLNFLSISDSTASPNATFYAGANSTNGGNVDAWLWYSCGVSFQFVFPTYPQTVVGVGPVALSRAVGRAYPSLTWNTPLQVQEANVYQLSLSPFSVGRMKGPPVLRRIQPFNWPHEDARLNQITAVHMVRFPRFMRMKGPPVLRTRVGQPFTPPKQEFTLGADQGTYTLSGAQESYLYNRVAAAGAGVYTLTGVAATLVHGYLFPVSPGTYVLTGDPAALLAARLLKAAAGSYSISGAAASALATRLLGLAPGAYLISGKDAALLTSAPPTLLAALGIYLINGADVSMVKSGAAKVGKTPPFAYAPIADLADKLKRKRKDEEEIAAIISMLDEEDDE